MAPTPLLAAAALMAVAVASWSLAAAEQEGAGNLRQPPVAQGLSFDFYRRSCPRAETIVQEYVKDAVRKDVGIAAGLLRLHFHDCFVQGCDASVLLDGSATGPGEQQAPPNLTLRPSAFAAINAIRDRLERECRGAVVSCSDILALAARDSVAATGGPSYRVPLGRRDSPRFATVQDVLSGLPAPTATMSRMPIYGTLLLAFFQCAVNDLPSFPFPNASPCSHSSVVRPQTPFATTAGPPPTAGGKGGGVPVHHHRGSSAVRVRLAAPRLLGHHSVVFRTWVAGAVIWIWSAPPSPISTDVVAGHSGHLAHRRALTGCAFLPHLVHTAANRRSQHPALHLLTLATSAFDATAAWTWVAAAVVLVLVLLVRWCRSSGAAVVRLWWCWRGLPYLEEGAASAAASTLYTVVDSSPAWR
ncbi:hypothetical protein QYE76_058734 [Lolium multiflorum]|uniref:Peroxidase n=1 Tax=Lolium multiflorum TaxID=4521 RepID=A0AAD8T7P3_LOLMU|nr:hypothetical protein QYE76_058734 [Lolium multiflorum]